jgi:hypothetical protein
MKQILKSPSKKTKTFRQIVLITLFLVGYLFLLGDNKLAERSHFEDDSSNFMELSSKPFNFNTNKDIFIELNYGRLDKNIIDFLS